ncbi:DUF7059 domain-containing protein [Frigoribacterium salinisoli]
MPLRLDDALLSRLRADLAASDFTVDRLSAPDAWGPAAGAALFRGERVAARRALERSAAGSEAARASGTLALLFVLGYPQPLGAVASALPTLGVDGARELGLVAVEGDEVRPLMDLRPYAFVDAGGEASWWIVSDLGELAVGGALREDHVLGVGGASATLAGLMVPRPVDRALDLGTGCGIQALHLARHARHVVATDISQRALDIAAFNAALNLVDGVEFRLGSLFEPVAGEVFDHIVSNPPFVITPRAEGVPEYEYRDGGMVGDELVATVVAAAVEHLVPGGVAQLLGNWETGGATDAAGGAPGPSRKGAYSVPEWAARGSVAVDAWVVERELQDPAAYAETWIRDGGTRPGTPDFERLTEAWLDDFERRGVTEVGFGYVTLRRPVDAAAVPVVRVERLQSGLGRDDAGLGAHVLQTLDAVDALRGATDDDVLATHWTVAGDVTEERHFWPGQDDPTVIRLQQGGGFARTVESGTALSALVGASAGELSAAAIVAALAQLLQADEADLRAELAPRVRELVTVGVLRR